MDRLKMFSSPKLDWVVAHSGQITFFCRHCQQTENKHIDGHCLFEATTFAFEPHAVIADRLCKARFTWRPVTEHTAKEVAEYLKQVLKDLERAGIPNDP